MPQERFPGLQKLAKELSKVELLIIDEWFREPLTQAQANELLDLIDTRFRRASTLFVSQVPVEDWHAAVPNPTLADAILDRIVHDALRMELKGESMRKATSPLNKALLIAPLPRRSPQCYALSRRFAPISDRI